MSIIIRYFVEQPEQVEKIMLWGGLLLQMVSTRWARMWGLIWATSSAGRWSIKEVVQDMNGRWVLSVDRLNLRANGKGNYTVWGAPVYHSRARNKLILTVILLLDRSEAPPSTECFSVSGLQIILPQKVLMKVLRWTLNIPQYNINTPDSEVLYIGS